MSHPGFNFLTQLGIACLDLADQLDHWFAQIGLSNGWRFFQKSVSLPFQTDQFIPMLRHACGKHSLAEIKQLSVLRFGGHDSRSVLFVGRDLCPRGMDFLKKTHGFIKRSAVASHVCPKQTLNDVVV